MKNDLRQYVRIPLKIIYPVRDVTILGYSQSRNLPIFSNFPVKHPYTKIDFVVRDVGIQRAAAARYLDALAGEDFLVKQKLWRSNYYINQPLFELLQGR